MRDLAEIRVRGVDQHVAIRPCDDRGDDQDRGPLRKKPSVAIGAAHRQIREVPAGNIRGRYLLYVDRGNFDGDRVLILRNAADPGMGQPLQHGAGKGVRGIDDGMTGRIPTGAPDHRAGSVVDRVTVVGDAPGAERPLTPEDHRRASTEVLLPDALPTRRKKSPAGSFRSTRGAYPS